MNILHSVTVFTFYDFLNEEGFKFYGSYYIYNVMYYC
jgi:hypothetical protein